MHRRSVSFYNQCDIHRSHQDLHCSLTDRVFGDLEMRFGNKAISSLQKFPKLAKMLAGN